MYEAVRIEQKETEGHCKMYCIQQQYVGHCATTINPPDKTSFW